MLKKDIENKLNNMELSGLLDMINKYEAEVPMDMDLISYKCLYYIYSNNIDKALQYGLLGIEQYPTNGDFYYNAAYIYELKNDIISACKNYMKAYYIFESTGNENSQKYQLKEKVANLFLDIKKEEEYAQQNSDTLSLEIIKAFKEQYIYCFGFNEMPVYKGVEQVIGNYYWTSEDTKHYIGLYKLQFNKFLGETNWDLLHTKAEFLQVTEGNHGIIKGEAKEYFLPIAADEINTIHMFKKDSENIIPVLQKENKHFNYYKVPSGIELYSSNKSFYGRPLPIGHDCKKKKLVLNIFIDGLAQEVLNGNAFSKLMPYTYEFFKKGTICTQAYSSADWTYPSIASITTGLDTIHHKMFHNKLDTHIPKNITTLNEYFHETGYFTSMLSGDWRITPSYGYIRGCDQFIYQHSIAGLKAETVISEAIEHLEAFQDVDQFFWLSIGDLHDIADGLDLSLAVQRNLELEDRKMEDEGETSVKQGYSPGKIKAYKTSISYIDILLNALYTYIEKKYADEEFIISLFADHGQGYLVPKDGKFLSKERSKVAFMFRGCGIPMNISNEIISTCDYVKIMCKLSGIPIKDNSTVGNLPVCFGGKQEREYALTESLHPGDPYYAAFFTKDYVVYFENGSATDHDGRFLLKDYKISIKDLEGNQINDETLLNMYFNIILEHTAPVRIYES